MQLGKSFNGSIEMFQNAGVVIMTNSVVHQQPPLGNYKNIFVSYALNTLRSIMIINVNELWRKIYKLFENVWNWENVN